MSNIPLSAIPPSGGQPPAAPPQAPPAPPPSAPAAPASPPRVAPGLIAQPPAAPPAPAPQAPPQAPQFKIKFRGQELELDPSEAQRLAQIGMSAENLSRQREEFEARRRETDDLIKAGQLVAGVAQTDPNRFQMIRSIMAGRLDETAALLSRAGVRGQPQPGGSELDDPLTPQAAAPSIPFEVEQRIAQLEAQIQRQQNALHQRAFDEGIDSAIARREFLRGNPQAAALARSQIASMVRAGEVDDPDNAALVIEQQMKALVAGQLEQERRAREAQREHSPVRGGPAPVDLPKLGADVATYANLKSGRGREQVRNWLQNLRAAVSGPNQT